MARDGGGVYSKPAGSTATTGTTILASEHNTPVDDFVTDANLKRPIVAGGTNATTEIAMRDNFDVDGKVISKSSAYTAVLGDRSKLIRCTAALTLSLTAASTLGDGWFIDVEADTGTTTIDPDGTENIDGSSTSYSLTVGQTVRVRCNGSAFFTQFLSLTIGSDVQAWDADLDTYAGAPLTAAELGQLQNIGSATISSTQWGYVGAASAGYTSTEATKLATIETAADITDTANVTTAGALMDSELTNIAAVKATTGTFLTADQTKLDGIEALADVTDATNVTASGALMDSELANIAAVKALNQGVATTDNVTFAKVITGTIASPDATNVIFVSNTAKVGIGHGTPAEKLHVNGVIRSENGSAGEIQLYNGSSERATFKDENTGAYIGTSVGMPMYFGTNSTRQMVLDGDKVGIGTLSVQANTALTVEGATTENTWYALKVQNSAQGNLFTVRNDGNVGIGTSSPSADLQINDGDVTRGVAGTFHMYGSAVNGDAGDVSNEIFFRDESVSDWGGAFIRTVRSADDQNGKDALTFGTSPSGGSVVERMRVDASGCVLIGKDASGFEFTAKGTQFAADGGTYFVRSANPAIHVTRLTNNGAAIQFFNSAATSVGTIVVTGSNTAYNTTSDYRLKEDIQPMTGATERVLALNPINFAWKVDGSRVDGFLAHEAQEVVPECISGTKDAMRDEEYEVTPALGEVFTPAIDGIDEVTETVVISPAIEAQDAVMGEFQVTETVETGTYVNLAGVTITETREVGVTEEATETVVERQEIDGISTEVEVERTVQVAVMESYEVTPAIEAVAEVTEVNVITKGIEAIAEVILETDVERPTELTDQQQWRETAAQVMDTRSVPDMQGIDQAKIVPLLVAALQEALARIESLEA